MPGDEPDEQPGEQPGEQPDDGRDRGETPSGGGTGDDGELGAAVDDALSDELRRQKARFVQQILGLDRQEGTGRRDERWGEDLDEQLGMPPRERDRPEDPPD